MKSRNLYAPPLSTFNDVVITQDSIEAWTAFTNKAVDVVPADGTIPARLAGTLVHLNLTVFAFKPRATLTRKAPDIIHTRASIQARVYSGGIEKRS